MKPHCFIFAAFAAAPCFAQTPESPPTALDPLVVTATRSEQSTNRLPAAVTVITRKDIDASGASHLVQVLRLAGAAQVTEFFGDGSRATVDLRGFGDGAHSTTLVLVDGRRLNNSDIAPPDLNTLSLKDIERIEIIQGSAGVLYGDQAVGGVINIITRTPQRFEAAAEIGAGSYEGLQARGAVSHRAGGFSLRWSAESRDTDNYREHNALEYRNALLRLGYDRAGGGVFGEFGWIEEDLETPGALFADEMQQDRRQATANFQGDFSDTDTGFARVNWRQLLGEDWELQTDLTHRQTDGVFRLSSVFGPSSSDSTQDRDIQSVNPRLTGAFAGPWGAGLLTAGIDALFADYELTSPFGTQTNDQRQTDGYLQAILPLPARFEATLGARQARVDNEVLDGFTFVAPTRFHDTRTAGEAGLAWRPLKTLRVFTRYDRNFRFAKVDEFTNAGATPGSGNVNLRTQTGDSYELGAEIFLGAVALRSTAYRLDSQNEITFDPATFTNINLDRTRRDGIIAEADFDVWSSLTVGARYHRLHSEIRGGALSGKDIPLVSPQTAKLWAGMDLPAGIALHAEVLAVDDRPFAGDFDNTLSRLPGHAVANLSLGWVFHALHLDGRVNNLLGKEYAEYGAAAGFPEQESFFPSPERNYWLSARYDW
jgi:iron complex outermembrane receptor protein